MSTATHNALVQVLTVLGALTAPFPAPAQEPPDELTPRAIADSTYAVRVAIDALAESIRRGRLDPRQLNDAALSGAVAGLASAAGRRTRQPPHPDLGVLWDFRIEIAGFAAALPDALVTQARVILATVVDSSPTPATLTYARRGDRWNLVAYQGFAERLAEMTAQLARGTGP